MRDRWVLPIMIPLGAFALIGAVAFTMSRVLLNVPKDIATAIAALTAVNLLAAFAYLAIKKVPSVSTLGLLGGVVALPLLVGAAVAAGAVRVENAGGHDEKPARDVPVVAVAAKNIAFDKTNLAIPAGKEFKLTLRNDDTAPHNVTILEAKGSTKILFTKDFFAGPKSVTWKVSPIAAGNYYFQCDVHPNMSGTVTAAATSPSADSVLH